MLAFRWFLLILGALGVLDTLLVSAISSLNLGVLLPALLGAPLLVLGIFLPRLQGFFARGVGAFCKWALLCGYIALLVAFAVTWAVIDTAAHREAPENADVVIVLGAGLRGEKPTRVLRNRLDTAIDYLKQNPKTVAIVSGGKGEGEHISEAQAMARYLLEAGIPQERCILEDQSTSTKENFQFSGEIITQLFGSEASIVFVTTDFHIYRAGRVAARQGIEAAGIAAPDSWYVALNNHLRECMAIWAYLLNGSI